MFTPGADALIGQLIDAWEGVPFPGSSSVQPVVLEESVQLTQDVGSYVARINTEVQLDLITATTPGALAWDMQPFQLPAEPVWVLGLGVQGTNLANLDRGSVIHNPESPGSPIILDAFQGAGAINYANGLLTPARPSDWPRIPMPYLAQPVDGAVSQSLELHVLSNAGGAQTVELWILWARARNAGGPVIPPR